MPAKLHGRFVLFWTKEEEEEEEKSQSLARIPAYINFSLSDGRLRRDHNTTPKAPLSLSQLLFLFFFYLVSMVFGVPVFSSYSPANKDLQ